jgi:hypothetical protein
MRSHEHQQRRKKQVIDGDVHPARAHACNSGKKIEGEIP